MTAITTYDLGTRTFQGTRAEIQAMLAALRATRNDPATHEETARYIEDGLRGIVRYAQEGDA